MDLTQPSHGGDAAASAPVEADSRRVAELRHQFRNQIQTMSSLISLFGDRLPEGDGRRVLSDLRVRFEAVAALHGDEFSTGGPIACDRLLAGLAVRICSHYDPSRRRAVAFAATPFRTDPRRAGMLAQILAEMLIDLFRAGFADGAAGPADVTVRAAEDGAISMRVDLAEAGPEPAAGQVGDLGVAILRSLAQGLDGSLTRRRGDGLRIEVAIPGRTAQS
ncbi:hypothetical protein [Hansschlegelia plantiphila]|uniref:Sensor histidine kinase n=1 Tax=Hansschlegelia plantiphila TaxID=374655 RepID=A0A9W6MWX4_9HYPH|nr:hypothetical protein [Hansschlegelia plantiphila]GLK69325.1 hypothetical protein GCM10008179_29630 [Hansschlegelia plantiphila]